MKRGTIFILLLTLISLPACVRRKVKEEPQNIKRLSETVLQLSPAALKNIVIDKAEMRELPEHLDLMGRVSVTEDRTTVIPARVAGRIDAIYLASGEFVRQNQALVSLFSPDFISAREEYLQALKESRIIAANGERSDFGNLSALARKRLQNMGLTNQDIDNLQNQEPSNPSLLIRATRSGVIIEKKAQLGSLVAVGDTLFTIADISKLWFSGDLYPEDLPRVHQRDQDVVIEDIPGEEPLHGKISFISPVFDPVARTVKIRALMDNPHNDLRADMYVHGSIILNRKKALLVPTKSVLRNGSSRNTCSRKKDENTFEKVSVTTKEESQSFTSIESGLAEGNEVVADGALYLEAAILRSSEN